MILKIVQCWHLTISFFRKPLNFHLEHLWQRIRFLESDGERCSFFADHYWNKWIREYLPTLQKRSKWVKSRRNVQIGDLVLIAEDNVLRNRWPMGRVMELFCGEDRGVQYVKIKTAEVRPAWGSFLNRHVSWVFKDTWFKLIFCWGRHLFSANLITLMYFLCFQVRDIVVSSRSQSLEPKRRCFRMDPMFFFFFDGKKSFVRPQLLIP